MSRWMIQHRNSLLRSIFIVVAAALAMAGTSLGQTPMVSVNTQTLAISYDDCLARAKQALDLEGYATARGGGNFYWGAKGTHHATIVCDGAPDNQTDVHVFVASTTNDSNIVGGERAKLQQRMNNPVTDGTGGSGGGVETISWRANAKGWRGKNGQRFTVRCDPGSPSADLWGTDLYTDDTSICTAAVHAGLITTAAGGVVTIEIRGGASSYQGSARNGLTSNPYGSWSGSYVFVGSGSGTGTGGTGGDDTTNLGTVEWNKQADGWRGQNGKRFTMNCKPGGQPSSRLWGTDIYTDDSSICTAAVHAGIITAPVGGIVTIEIRPGAASYTPSTRYGLTSNSYGSWSGSFVFVTRRWIE